MSATKVAPRGLSTRPLTRYDQHVFPDKQRPLTFWSGAVPGFRGVGSLDEREFILGVIVLVQVDRFEEPCQCPAWDVQSRRALDSAHPVVVVQLQERASDDVLSFDPL